jgi:hypothetical protein
MAIELGTVTAYGLIALIINGVALWIREWRKHRTWNTNGDDLKEIKEDVKTTNGKVDCIDKKVGETKIKIAEIKTAVNAQKTQCAVTVERFDKTITGQGKEIIKLAWKKENKR